MNIRSALTLLTLAIITQHTFSIKSYQVRTQIFGKLTVKKAFQFLAYRSKQDLFGSHSTLINANAAHLNSKNLNVRAVVLEEDEFNKDTVKTAIDNKASGIVALVPNQSFVPSQRWSEGYDYLRRISKV